MRKQKFTALRAFKTFEGKWLEAGDVLEGTAEEFAYLIMGGHIKEVNAEPEKPKAAKTKEKEKK